MSCAQNYDNCNIPPDPDPNEFWTNLWIKSDRIKKELLLMSRYASVGGSEYPAIYSETIGSEGSVQGFSYLRGVNITHTHLDSHPPSTTDYMHEIRSRATYDTLYHRVITQCHIWHYCASSVLIHQINYLLRSTQDKTNNHKKLAKLLSSLSDQIHHINKEFIKSGDCALYIRKLKNIGFNVSVFHRNSETELPKNTAVLVCEKILQSPKSIKKIVPE